MAISMWIARIARPGAIYDASAAARAFATIEEFRGNESDCEHNATDVISEALAKTAYSLMPGYGELVIREMRIM